MKEQEIIRRLLSRDEAGMEALLIHYGPLMRYVIAPFLEDFRDREDCLSEAAMQVWEKIGQFDGKRGSWNAWLTAIARNTAKNHVRRNARHGPPREIPPDTPAAGPTPEEAVMREELQKDIVRALRGLSPGERLLFYRKYYYRQSTDQIASELGMSRRAVEGRLYRLKKKLRKLLGGENYG